MYFYLFGHLVAPQAPTVRYHRKWHCRTTDVTWWQWRSLFSSQPFIVKEGNMHTISKKWRHDVLRYWLEKLFGVIYSLVYWPFTQEVLERNSQPIPSNARMKSAPKSRCIWRCRPKCTLWRTKCTPPFISSNDKKDLGNYVIAYNNMSSSFSENIGWI